MKTYDPTALIFDPVLARKLKFDIIGEILKAIKWPDTKVLRFLISSIVGLPTRRFAEIMADFDRVIGEKGLRFASDHLLEKLINIVTEIGVEMIPSEGPTIIASNHPGTYDALAILSQLPREDVKIIVGSNPFFCDMPNGRKFLIFATRKQNERFEVIRQAIHHLQKGGLLLIFPAGHIDPDPAIFEVAEERFQNWSRSLTVFLRKVPQTKLILAVTSGVITKEYINHPLPNLFKGHERRRIIEFMQVIKQMIFHQTKDLNPKICFKEESRYNPHEGLDHSKRMDSICSQEFDLFQAHLKEFYTHT
jgi:hypothetical protein